MRHRKGAEHSNKLGIFLVSRSYRQVDEGIYVSQMDEDGWESWLSYNYEHNEYGRILFGWRTSKFLDIMFLAKKAAFEMRHNIVVRSQADLPMFMACTDDIELSDGNWRVASGQGPSQRSLEWAMNSIVHLAEPFLQSSKTYEDCLRHLETYSRGLPMYVLHKIVLLKVLGRKKELEQLVGAWLGSMLASLEIVSMHKKFAAVVSEQS